MWSIFPRYLAYNITILQTTDMMLRSNVWSMSLYVTLSNGKVCVQHFGQCKLQRSKLTNVNILCLVQFGSGWNKWVQLLIRSRNSGGRTISSLVCICLNPLYIIYYWLMYCLITLLTYLWTVRHHKDYRPGQTAGSTVRIRIIVHGLFEQM